DQSSQALCYLREGGGGMTITDVLGRQREAGNVWPDGSYNCPFCASAVLSEADERFTRCSWPRCQVAGLHCQNPWCTANPHMPVASAQEIVDRAEQRRQEEARRERDHQLWRERMDATKRADDETWAAARAEAERKGACVVCLLKSDWRGFQNPW